MTQAQRAVIEEVIRKADRGPSFGLSGFGKDAEEHFENRARLWAETWIAYSLQSVLDNVDGKKTASELRQLAR